MENKVFLTFFIPVYNAASFISNTLQIFKMQTCQNFEVIFIDDCSTDNTYDIINNFVNENKNSKAIYKVYKTEKNLGAGHYHLPKILKYINGEYFFAFTHDDRLDDDFVEKCYKRSKEGDFDILLTNLAFSSNNKVSYLGKEILEKYNEGKITNKDLFEKSLRWEISVAGPRKIELLQKCGYFSDKYYNIDEYSVRLSFLYTNKIAYVNTCYYYTVGIDNALSVKIKPFAFDRIITDVLLLEKLIQFNYNNKIFNKRLKEVIDYASEWNDKYYANITFFTKEEKKYIKQNFKIVTSKLFSMGFYYKFSSWERFIRYNFHILNNHVKYIIGRYTKI